MKIAILFLSIHSETHGRSYDVDSELFCTLRTYVSKYTRRLSCICTTKSVTIL